MNLEEALTKLQERNSEIDPLQFEHLCKIVVEEVEDPEGIETTRDRKDGGIDIRGFEGSDFYNGEFGIQVKQYESKISEGTVRGLAGSLQGQGCRFGTLITTSTYTKDALQKVSETEPYSIELINGEELAELMLNNELGVKEQPSEGDPKYTLDPEFWSTFDKFAGDLIPSWKVPQADSFEVLNLVLNAIENGHHFKPDIVEFYVETKEESWAARQADYYTTAGQILGFLEESEPEADEPEMRKWILTDRGEEYVEYLHSDKDEKADELLSKRVAEIEIIQKIFEKVQEDYRVPKSTVEKTIREETEVTGTTVGRRASTVGKWLGRHPDVKRIESDMIWFEYYEKDLDDFS